MAEEANPFLCSSRLAGSSMSRCSLNSFCLSPLCLLVKLVSICSRRWRLNFFWKIHGLAFSSNILSGIILLKEILKGKPGGNESNVSKHILRGSWIPFPKSRKKKKNPQHFHSRSLTFDLGPGGLDSSFYVGNWCLLAGVLVEGKCLLAQRGYSKRAFFLPFCQDMLLVPYAHFVPFFLFAEYTGGVWPSRIFCPSKVPGFWLAEEQTGGIPAHSSHSRRY